MISIIVAKAKNNAIGMDNKLLWHISEDLKRFKRITDGKTILMGRKTFQSLPGVLPNRKHIIATKNKDFKTDDNIITDPDLQSLLQAYSDPSCEEEVFVIGGASVYSQALPYCGKLYFTIVERDFEGDTFFPEIDYNEWAVLERSETMTDEKSGINFYYLTLERK